MERIRQLRLASRVGLRGRIAAWLLGRDGRLVGAGARSQVDRPRLESLGLYESWALARTRGIVTVNVALPFGLFTFSDDLLVIHLTNTRQFTRNTPMA